MTTAAISVTHAERAGRTCASRVRSIVELHYDSVWRALRRFGVEAGAADDAAQQVFCVLARRIDEIAPGKERSFLFGVALRVAKNAQRALRRHPETSAGDALEALESPCEPLDEALDARRARALLEQILGQMTPECRAVFVLYEIEELTMAEIAIAIDVPTGTVASRLRRARAVFSEGAARLRASVTLGGEP